MNKQLKQIRSFLVVAAYDGPAGPRGKIISRHVTYDAADRKVRRMSESMQSFVRIVINEEIPWHARSF